jgi:hypothetical protein
MKSGNVENMIYSDLNEDISRGNALITSVTLSLFTIAENQYEVVFTVSRTGTAICTAVVVVQCNGRL